MFTFCVSARFAPLRPLKITYNSVLQAALVQFASVGEATDAKNAIGEDVLGNFRHPSVVRSYVGKISLRNQFQCLPLFEAEVLRQKSPY
jgi:hypothetical protein